MVGAHTLNHQFLVLFTKALCPHGGVRHPEEHEEPPQDTRDAVGHEERLPGFDGGGRGDVCECVGEDAADDLLPAVHHVPVCDGLGLLVALVPHGGEHEENGLTAGFEDPEEGAHGDEAGEVVACGMKGEDSTPEDNVDAEVFGNWHSLNYIVCRKSEIETLVSKPLPMLTNPNIAVP